MLTLLVSTTVLAVLFGLAWHNEPASEAVRVRHSNRK
jgi:hypothetical protein